MRSAQHQLARGLAAAALSVAASQGWAEQPVVLADSTLGFDVRLRYEQVDDQLNRDADALTLRTALTWKTGPLVQGSAWSALVDIENTASLSRRDYSDGVRDRGTALIADPASTELNQLHLTYASPSGLTAKLGRQTISYGDERFIGSVAFRQNHQSFDALSVNFAGAENWDLSYAYVANVNRIFGDRADDEPAGLAGDHEQNTHLANAVYSGWSAGELEGYAYLIDNEDLPRFSTDTVGVRFSGSTRPQSVSYLYTAEFARQRAGGNNPREYSANYWRLEAGLAYKRVSLEATHERLESDNLAGFVTPLATLHRYQGWADKFVALTPNEGLIANSLTLAGRWPGFRYRLQYHEFNADVGSGRAASTKIGREFGFHLQYRFRLKYFAELKYARYRAQSGAASATGVAGLDSDTSRLFLTLSASLGA